jgi:hypothetical protein
MSLSLNEIASIHDYLDEFTLYLVCSLIVASILYRFIYSHGARTLGFLISKSVNYVAGSHLTLFKLGKLNLGTLPYIEDFECTIKSNKQYVADYSIKFKKVRVEIKWNPLLVPFYNTMQGVIQRSCVEYNKWCCRFTLLHQWGLMKAPVPLKKKERRKAVGRKTGRNYKDKAQPQQATQTDISVDMSQDSWSNVASMSYEGRRRSLTDTRLANRVEGTSVNTPVRRRATSTISGSAGSAPETSEGQAKQTGDETGGADANDVAATYQEAQATSDDKENGSLPAANASKTAYNAVSDKIIQIIFTDLEVSGDKLTYLDLLGSSPKKKTDDGSKKGKDDDSADMDSDSDSDEDNDKNEQCVGAREHVGESSQIKDEKRSENVDKKPETEGKEEISANVPTNEAKGEDEPDKKEQEKEK